jgi:hypothetical protein
MEERSNEAISCFYLSSLPLSVIPAQAEIHLLFWELLEFLQGSSCVNKGNNLSSQVEQASHRLFYEKLEKVTE